MFFIGFCSFSQETTVQINGFIQLEDNKEGIEGAKIIIENFNDSTEINCGLTNAQGQFNLTYKSADSLLKITVSYLYCISHSQILTLNQAVFNLDTIVLVMDEQLLNMVTVVSKALPVTIKNDTILYNVDSFESLPEATTEDLLKILPGIEVDTDGSILVNGKEVDKILVNGKLFFGNDLTIATKNLPKDFLISVQVTDTKTKSESFTGEESSSDTKTINLILKEDKNKGYFGELSVGGGASNQYELNGLLNRFNDAQRISVVGGTNNINAPRFTQQMGNSEGESFGSSNGISKSFNYGVNFSDEISDKLSIEGSYFRTKTGLENGRHVQRENILPNSRFFTNSLTSSLNKNDDHAILFGIDLKINPSLLINIISSLSIRKNNTIFSGSQHTFDESYISTNLFTTNSTSDNINQQLSNGVSLTKKIGKKGASFKFGVIDKRSWIEISQFNTSETIFLLDTGKQISRDQFMDNTDRTNKTSLETAFKFPLINEIIFLSAGLNYQIDNTKYSKSTYDKEEATALFSLFNSDLSNDFHLRNQDLRPHINFSLKHKKWNAKFKTTYVYRIRENNDVLRPMQSIEREFKSIEISSNFSYRYNARTNISGSYNLNTQPPLLYQLQAFPNLTNPLNTIVGNPDLLLQNNHRVNIGVNNYNYKKNQSFFSNLNVDFRNNQVVQKSEISESFTKQTTYVNTNGGYTISGNFTFNKGMNIDSVGFFRLKLGVNPIITHSIIFNNNIKYSTISNTIVPNIKLTLNLKKHLEFSTTYLINLTRNVQSLENSVPQNFSRHQVDVSASLNVLKNLKWYNQSSLTYNPNVSIHIQKTTWIWNSVLTYSFKKGKVKLSLKVYDVLNQNKSINQIVTSTYIENSESIVLQRYLMISINWKINRM